ncbi:NAD(P)-binding domain superfamily protein [Abortiporus biennis]
MATEYTYTSFAILGATGKLGQELLRSFSEHPLSDQLDIRILTRPSSFCKACKLGDQYDLNTGSRSRGRPLNITVFQIDYVYGSRETHQVLREALKDVDVVISLVGDDSGLNHRDGHVRHIGELSGFKAQLEVAKAAKAAGVKLFVPSEFGYPTHTIPSDSAMFLVGKKHFLDYLQAIKLPWLIVYSGTFPSIEPDPLPPSTPGRSQESLPPFITTRWHLASYVVYLLLDVLPEATEWGIFRILGLKRDQLVEENDGDTKWVLHDWSTCEESIIVIDFSWMESEEVTEKRLCEDMEDVFIEFYFLLPVPF